MFLNKACLDRSMAGAKFGCYIFQDALTFEEILKIARQCERLGLESVWLKDNFAPWLQKWFKGQKAIPNASFLESWTTLSALASLTKKIRIGCVLVNLYRQPSLVAKMASTLDAISDGRLELGLSAGWNREECASYGIAFPRASTRRKMLAEAVKVIKMMWAEQTPSFRGEHYSLHRALCWPKPIQKPHPPVILGGSGPGILKRVVAYADGWMPNRGDVLDRLEELRELTKAAGRSEIPVTVYPKATPEEIEQYQRAGIDRCIWYVSPDGRDQALASLEKLEKLTRPYR